MEPAHGFGIVEGRTEEEDRAVSAITAAGTGLDTESLEFLKESLEEFARRELPCGLDPDGRAPIRAAIGTS